MNYQRVVQWLSGPFAALVGLGAARVATLGTHPATAHGVLGGTAFVTTSLVTYAAHHKWLANLAKWWELSGVTDPASQASLEPPPAVDSTPPATGQSVNPIDLDILRAQLRAQGIEPNA
jgi:hypothetical protein